VVLALIRSGSLPGVLVGTKILSKAPPELIKRILGIALIGASVKLITSQF
jgi:uncharacterized membrane protein YfcA